MLCEPAKKRVISTASTSSNSQGSIRCTSSFTVPQFQFGCSRSVHTATQLLPPLPTGTYEVEVAVKAFEACYVQRAATVIRDLMMIDCAPKSRSALSDRGKPTPQPATISIPDDMRDVRINWKKTRFTVIRGPHIDKPGMEQFERRQYKAVLRVSTNSADEVCLESCCRSCCSLNNFKFCYACMHLCKLMQHPALVHAYTTHASCCCELPRFHASVWSKFKPRPPALHLHHASIMHA